MPTHGVERKQSGTKILFPGSGLARKGAYEIRQLASDLDLSIKILDGAVEDPSFWNGVNVEKASTNLFHDVALVIYPAYVDHQPRMLLQALASGIPVVTTAASGLSESQNVSIVPIGDYPKLKQAVNERLCKQEKRISQEF